MTDRWREYQICKVRGHQLSGFTTASVPPMSICKHCGTYYWTERIEREANAPRAPGATSAEEVLEGLAPPK